MALYSKAHFAVRHAASTDETRYNLNGVHFRADGSTEATDGHMLLRATVATPPADDFPARAGLTVDTGAAVVPFILPLDAAERVVKSIPKGRTLNVYPVLAHAALDVPHTNGNGSARFVATDLEADAVTESQKIDGEYPKTAQVVDPVREKAEFAFSMNLRLLERVVKAAKEFEKAHDRKASDPIPVSVYASGPLEPVRIVLERDGDELEAIVMPMRK